MKIEDGKFKNLLRDMIKSAMETNSPAEFKKARVIVYNFYAKTNNSSNLEKIRSMLKEISYQSVINTIADKDAEKLLVLNEDGTSTGRYADRKVVHDKKNLLWHREIAGIILRENKTFAIITRSFDKKSYPGAKGLVCGHVEGKTSLIEAAVAECSEEVGVLFSTRNMVRLMNQVKNERDDNKAYTTPYITASQLKPGVFIYQEEEVAGVEWITVDRLKQYIELSKNPAFKNMVIFKDSDFYRALINSLEKLFTLENWHDYLSAGDYTTIHKHLGMETPKEDIEYYEKAEEQNEEENI